MVGKFCITENYEAEIALLNLVKEELPTCLSDDIIEYWAYNADFALACYEDRILWF